MANVSFHSQTVVRPHDISSNKELNGAAGERVKVFHLNLFFYSLIVFLERSEWTVKILLVLFLCSFIS